MRRHYFGAQCIPLNQNKVVCLNCGKVTKIGDWPTGKRAKCSPTRRYRYLSDGATGQVSTRTGRLRVRSLGFAAILRAGGKE